MGNLQTTVSTYTTTQRATKIYQTVVDVFDWDRSSDCVTPFELALKQLEAVDVSGTVCIPGAGIGTYVLAAMQRGVQPGNIYAVELDAKYYELGSAMFERFGVNYVFADFLEWNPHMEFDAVIGNPPYQKSKYSDFYVCFMRKASELLKEGGYFSMIAPAKGAQPLSRAQQPLVDCGWNRVEFGVESYFPNIGTVIANYVGSKGELNDKLTVVINGEESQVDRGTVFPLTGQDKVAYSVVAKVFSHSDKMPFLRQKEAPSGNYIYVSRLIGTWHPAKSKGGPYALKAYLNEAPELNDGGFIVANSVEEAKHARWVITRSLVMRFVTNMCCRATFIPPMFWSLSPDLLQCQNDEDTFKVLGFTEAEIAYIKQWEKETYK